MLPTVLPTKPLMPIVLLVLFQEQGLVQFMGITTLVAPREVQKLLPTIILATLPTRVLELFMGFTPLQLHHKTERVRVTR